MKELSCDGCGLREDSRVPDPKRVIREVKLQVSTDSRSWAESERHEADLCPTCRGTLLHAYFGLHGGGVAGGARLRAADGARAEASMTA